MGAIRTERLTKSYGRRVALRSLDLDVPEGSVFGFLGPNGAGKTTAIRLLLGLLSPDHGRAAVLGHDCWRESPAVRRQVGYLPGDLRLPSWYDTRSALAVSGRTRGENLLPRGLNLAFEFGLDPGVRVGRMSRGMRQKLGLILALAHEPRVLVLDEPTSGLDPLNQRQLYRMLRDRAARGTTVFFSSHVLSEVEDLCDRVAILKEGELVIESGLDDLRKRARRRVVIRFSGPEPELPPFLDLTRKEGDRVVTLLTGEVPELLAWLTAQSVSDLLIGPPDLDQLFRTFYRDGGGDR